jgi:putative DNA primase/helicase
MPKLNRDDRMHTVLLPAPNGVGIRAKRRPYPGAQSSENLITEDSAALQFTALYRDQLRYCHDTGAWFVWDGSRWRKNTTGLAFHWARELARKLATDAPDKVRAIAGRSGFANGVEICARRDPGFAVTAEVWDSAPFLLGTPGGTVDLRTGLLRTANPAEGVTKLTAVTPTEHADCPLWLGFLE